MCLIVLLSTLSKLLYLFFINLTVDGGGVTVRIEPDLGAVEVILIDTGTSPGFAARGKVPAGVAYPVTVDPPTAGEGVQREKDIVISMKDEPGR